MRNRANLVGIACLLGFSIVAHADINDRLQAMTIDADRVSVNELKKTSLFVGHVVMTQGSLAVKADKVSFRQEESGDYFINAQGKPINFRQKQNNSPDYVEAFAEQLDFDSKAETIHLTGQAVLRHGKDEVRGDSIIYNMQTQQYEVSGGKSAGVNTGTGKQRVRLVIQPRAKVPQEPASAPGAKP